MTKTPPDRFELLSLLSEACELEHGLACAYLYAAFSFKQELSEGGMSWQQQQKVRKWAAQIFHVAAEEMLHLATAWNLQSALGGTPWYGRPNFPQSSSYYPLHLPLETKPFSLSTIERFIKFEHPSDEHAAPLPKVPLDPTRNYRSVGELYRIIREGILAQPQRKLFIGNKKNQVGPDLMDFPDLVRVVDKESASLAIDCIIEQGEGCSPDSKDSHYAIFKKIRVEYLEELLRSEQSGEVFQPVRPCISNPVAHNETYLGASNAQMITDPVTAEAADLFDSVYNLMLRLLQYVFDSSTSDARVLRSFSVAALRIMTSVIKPFGEALAMMPAGLSDYGNATAGAPFTIGRPIALPHATKAALTVAQEKLTQCNQRFERLLEAPNLPPNLAAAAQRLAAIQVNPATAKASVAKTRPTP